MEECEELSLMLYSRQPDYTFDLCYAFEKVTEEYDNFSKDKETLNEAVSDFNFEINRYARLAEVLRRIPPEREPVIELPDSLTIDNDTLEAPYSFAESQLERALEASLADSTYFMRSLDPQGEADRDSCLYYVTELLKHYIDYHSLIIADTALYHEATPVNITKYCSAKSSRTARPRGAPYSAIPSPIGKKWKKPQLRNMTV